MLRDRRPVGPRARRRRPPPLARPADAAPPARPRRAARAALPRPQDPRRRAVPLLMAATPTPRRFPEPPRLRAPRSSSFLRRLAWLAGDRRAARRGHGRLRGDRGHLGVDGLSLDARHGRHRRLDPAAARPGRAGADRPADRPGRRYALLRPGHGDRVLRRRASRRAARGAPHAADDRRPLRPLPDLRLRPRRPPGGARPARGGRPLRRDRREPRQPRARAGHGGALHRGRARPTTRSCARPGSSARGP